MKPTDITRRVEAIARVLDEDDKAHELEDALRIDFIKFVSTQVTVPISVRRKAKQIVEVSTWKFSRWYS
jgi:hypothetical protein